MTIPSSPTYSELAAGHCEDNAVIGRLIAERDEARAETERLISVLEEWCADPPAEMEDDGGWVDVVAVAQVQGLVDDWRKDS